MTAAAPAESNPEPALPSAGLGALFAAAAIWGIGPVFTRTLSLDLGPEDHLGIRYAIVALAYFGGLAASGAWRIAPADWPRLAFITIVGVLGYNLGSAYGFAHVGAGMGALIIGTQPLLIALFGAIAARERLTPAVLAGLAVGFAGTVLLVWNDLGAGGGDVLKGAALVFGAGICWAIYVVASKPMIRSYGAFTISAWSIGLNSLVLLALFARPHTLAAALSMSARTWMEMAYMALLSTFVATTAWNYGAGRVRAAAAGAFIYLVPIIGVVAGAFILDEAVTPSVLTGGALILAGVALTQFAPLLRR